MKETKFIAEGTKLTVKRSFSAPIDLVWRAWTEEELLDQWWAPAPWRSETKHMDFTEGGTRLYAMVGPEGEKHWGITEYLKINKEQDFTGKDSFCDEEGNINEQFPVATFTNQFEANGASTEVTMITTYPTEKDLQTVMEMGMKEGLTLALDQLEEMFKAKAVSH